MAIYNNDIDPNEIMWENQNNIKNKVMDIREQCRERATKFAIDYGFTNVSEHILDIMVSIMCTRDKSSYAGGGFVEAVIANNLYLALSRADTDCRNNIFLLTMCKQNCFLNEYDY
jgi:hypothetical protein